MEYVNLIIDNSSDKTDNLYTYGSMIPGLKQGDKVKVPFARGNKIRDAYVYSVIPAPEKEIAGLKYVLEKDSEVSLPTHGMEVAEWMRNRYFCRYIDGIKCFTPSGTAPKKRKPSQTLSEGENEITNEPALTSDQATAVEVIRPYLEKEQHQVFLIHGVTSSGKTEVYMQIIAECIARGKTAIMLVPEISLTAQTIERFIQRFGQENIAVLHSKLSLGQRYDQWMRAKHGQVKIVIGARSAVFAPFERIGTIIIDEEHETTYKSDMTPKYDTLEVAIHIAKSHNATVLLGSATPSLSTMHKALQGEYELITMSERYNKAPLPTVEIVDMREELQEGNKSIFSLALYQQIRRNLDEKMQVILFLNRRGYTTFLSCRNCGYVMRCKECNISMTYHKAKGEVICHYCGHKETVPTTCPVCHSGYIKHFGTGTEKVEEMAKEAFPEATIDRLDMDTASGKGSIERILSRFGKGKTDLLIGTQLVAKGLDFANVGLVGIISADISLNIPDYRSPERTFQLITQAAGRAGRGNQPGKVIIQTYSPDHYAIEAASNQDYGAFYDMEIKLRREIGYPPFSDIIQLVLSSVAEEEAEIGSQKIKEAFLRKVGKEHASHVLGPKPAPMNKLNGLFRYQLLIKCQPEHWESYQKALFYLKKKVAAEKSNEWVLSIDVNPYGFL